MTAPTTARPAASGRIVPETKFHNEASMSVVANCEPLLKLCIICTVEEMASRKMAVMIEPSGLSPWAPSSAAFNTKKDARSGTSFPTTSTVTKLLKLPSSPASHGLATDPPCAVISMPCPPNHERSWGSVRKMTDHSIHLGKLPPTWKFTPPSCRRARPASTTVHIAAGTARSNRSVSRSVRNCGVVIVVLYSTPVLLLDSRLARCDPGFDQAGQTGDQQQARRGDRPACDAAPVGVVDDRHDHARPCSYRADHIAHPVHQVQKRAFRLRGGLSLDSLVKRRLAPGILRLGERCNDLREHQYKEGQDQNLLPSAVGVRHLHNCLS